MLKEGPLKGKPEEKPPEGAGRVGVFRNQRDSNGWAIDYQLLCKVGKVSPPPAL
jgi:hypothetical protein